jgi:FdhD protein
MKTTAHDPASKLLPVTRRKAPATSDLEAHAPSTDALGTDWLAVEEPLQIRLLGEPFTTTMRTPGADRQLTAGVLLSEGLVTRREEIGQLVHCGRPGVPDYGNIMDVSPAPGFHFDEERLERGRRTRVINAACGVCGRGSIEDLLAQCQTLAPRPEPRADAIQAALWTLEQGQASFQRTGGTHAAALCRTFGGDAEPPGSTPFPVFEDVGRHNAVDKVLGHRLLYPAAHSADLMLVVSGRCSFEIVQKACVAGVPVVVSVSAPTSLAVETAQRVGMTLVAFARKAGFNVYGSGI